MEEKQKFKQNLLTRGLLASGYTVENHLRGYAGFTAWVLVRKRL